MTELRRFVIENETFIFSDSYFSPLVWTEIIDLTIKIHVTFLLKLLGIRESIIALSVNIFFIFIELIDIFSR